MGMWEPRGRRGARRLLALAICAGLLAGCGPRQAPDGPRARLSVAQALGAPVGEGFARADAPRQFVFPADHGPHPQFAAEWWYYTGNLEAEGGRRFGFQLTFFRFALAAAPPERESAWAASQIYTAHFALSDVAGERFHAAERLSRGAAGLAGAQAAPFRVWLEGWSAEEPAGAPISPAGVPPMRLRAADGDVAIDLALEPGKPPVLQGDRGLSQKSAEPGNASYYYSLTRMPAAGSVRVAGAEYAVRGLAWMDREWSTSALDPGQVGWDWFALQLDDGRELMFYRLRRADGGVDPHSRGSLVEPDGAARTLEPGEVLIEPQATWRSPHSGAEYPAAWRISVPSAALDLRVTPRLADQEMPLTVAYWEGAVRVAGSAGGRQIAGSGYVELTGYADAQGGAPRGR